MCHASLPGGSFMASASPAVFSFPSIRPSLPAEDGPSHQIPGMKMYSRAGEDLQLIYTVMRKNYYYYKPVRSKIIC